MSLSAPDESHTPLVMNVSARLRDCPVVFFAQTFGLERREENLRCGVVPAAPTAAHTTYDAVELKQALKVLAGVLGALVGMMQHCLGVVPDTARCQLSGILRRYAYLVQNSVGNRIWLPSCAEVLNFDMHAYHANRRKSRTGL